MIKKLSELKPYKSLLLARLRDGVAIKKVVRDAISDLKELLSLENGGPRKLISETPETKAGELVVGYLHYSEATPTPWTRNRRIVDQINHLILVCRHKRHVAIYLSDNSWRLAIVKELDKSGGKGLGAFQKITPGLLNAAFVNGAARTLWLSGAHARTSIKADNKVLSGVELQDALDPLGDQTYYFTAARCASGFDPQIPAVGSSPRGSRVWIGSSRDWSEFQQPVTALLKHLEGIKKPNRAPIPIVAISSEDSKNVKKPFDLAVIPPELLSDDPDISEETRKEIEKWSYNTNFSILNETKDGFTAEVNSEGTVLGTLEFIMDLTDPNSITWELQRTSASNDTEEELTKLVGACSRPTWVKIWYESGHTISDGVVIEVRHRDVPFKDLDAVNFNKYTGSGSYSKYDVKKEKPEPLNATTIGNQDSLFCWVKNAWPIGSSSSKRGWLACDDGAREIADFIHLDDSANTPKLSLIHVKGAKSASAARGIAVAPYEVVTSQAIKNLRFFDRLLLDEGMRAGMKRAVKDLVWHNGKPTSREKMLDALENIGSSFDREVIILQPHLVKARVESARSKPTGQDAAKLRQLDTLLLAQANSCHGLQARLRVVCADEPVTKVSSSKIRKK